LLVTNTKRKKYYDHHHNILFIDLGRDKGATKIAPCGTNLVVDFRILGYIFKTLFISKP
jgi:hypothetical protein